MRKVKLLIILLSICSTNLAFASDGGTSQGALSNKMNLAGAAVSVEKNTSFQSKEVKPSKVDKPKSESAKLNKSETQLPTEPVKKFSLLQLILKSVKALGIAIAAFVGFVLIALFVKRLKSTSSKPVQPAVVAESLPNEPTTISEAVVSFVKHSITTEEAD